MNFSDLPYEIIIKIGYILSSRDIHQFMTTCQIINKCIGNISWEDYFRNKVTNNKTLEVFNEMVTTIREWNIFELFPNHDSGDYIRFDMLNGSSWHCNYISITGPNKCSINKCDKYGELSVNISNEIFYKISMNFIITYPVKEILIFKKFSLIRNTKAIM